jgi:putative membrane protein
VPAGFSDDDARAAFRAAIESIERASCAEIVVAVRRHSSTYRHAHLLAGIAGAVAAHAYMLFGDHPFSTPSLFWGPIVAGLIVGLASTLVLPLERWATPASRRRRAVQRAARATFVDRGIRRTRGATGVLVYVSIVERMAELVADDGVVAAVSKEDWDAACAKVDAAVAHGGVATARALQTLAPILAHALPSSPDDINELPDDMDVGHA